MKKKSRSEPVIYTKESLRQEQRRLKLIIKQQETDLRQRVQQLPGEVLYACADAVLPAVLTGKISDKILAAGKKFVHASIVKKTSGHASRLVTAAKQAGILTLLKIGYNVFIKKKQGRNG